MEARRPRARPPERVCREFLRQRLDRESREQLVPRGLAGREQQAAESARIVEPQASPGIEHEVDVIVRERGRAGVEDAQAPRHAEMENQRARVGRDQQVLRAPADGVDPRSADFRGKAPRHAPAQAPFAHEEALDAPADEPGLDAPARRFYLG